MDDHDRELQELDAAEVYEFYRDTVEPEEEAERYNGEADDE